MRELLAVLMSGLGVWVVSCAREQRQNPPAIPSPAAPSGHESKIGAAISAQEAWPIPPGVVRSDGVATKLIHRGTGQVLPALNRDGITGIATVEYNTRGEVVGHVPFRVLAIDLAPQGWRDVLLQMHQGDVRRAWIRDRDDKWIIVDIELQRLVFPGPSDYAVNRKQK